MDRKIVERVLNNAATPEQAREVAKGWATKEGEELFNELFDQDVERLQSTAERTHGLTKEISASTKEDDKTSAAELAQESATAAPSAFAQEEYGASASEFVAEGTPSIAPAWGQDGNKTTVPEFAQERMEERLKEWIGKRRKNNWTTYLRRVAVWLLFALMGGTAVYLWERTSMADGGEYAEVRTATGERLQVAFQDGSVVLLNAQSSLRYPIDFGHRQRRVELTGEACFQVKKGDKRPFVVEAGGLDVEVLGTRFDVKAYPEEEVFVTLEEGAVRLCDHKLLNYRLKPGDQAIYNRLTGNCSIMRPQDMMAVTAWQKQKLYFYLTPLEEILKALERQFGVTFRVPNRAILKNRFTVSAPTLQMEDILKDIEAVSYIRFQPMEQGGYEVVSK